MIEQVFRFMKFCLLKKDWLTHLVLHRDGEEAKFYEVLNLTITFLVNSYKGIKETVMENIGEIIHESALFDFL